MTQFCLRLCGFGSHGVTYASPLRHALNLTSQAGRAPLLAFLVTSRVVECGRGALAGGATPRLHTARGGKLLCVFLASVGAVEAYKALRGRYFVSAAAPRYSGQVRGDIDNAAPHVGAARRAATNQLDGIGATGQRDSNAKGPRRHRLETAGQLRSNEARTSRAHPKGTRRDSSGLPRQDLRPATAGLRRRPHPQIQLAVRMSGTSIRINRVLVLCGASRTYESTHRVIGDLVSAPGLVAAGSYQRRARPGFRPLGEKAKVRCPGILDFVASRSKE